MPTENSAPIAAPGPQSDENGFRLLFHHHPLPMWIYSLETTAFLDVNDAALQKYGYSRAEFLQMTLSDIRPAEEVPRLQADLSQERPALQQSAGWHHRLKDGAIIDVEITSHTLPYQGQPAVLVTAQDITERVRLENELRQKSDALENSLNGFDIVSADGKLQYANRAYLQMWGYNSLAEILGTSPADHCLDPDIPRQIISNLQEKDEYRLEFTALRKDGSTFEVLMLAQRVVDDRGVVTYQGTSLDITERKRAEAELRLSEARLFKEQAFLRTLINTIPDFVWLKDVNGVYLSCNPAFERFYGAPAEEIIGKTDYDFVDASLADFFRQNDLATLAEDGPRINEEWVPHAGYGREILFETIKTPMLTAQGDVIGVLGIARDITTIRQAQLDLREREAKLNSLLKMLPVGISILGPDRKIVYANQALSRMIDMSPLGLSRGDYRQRRNLAADGTSLLPEQYPSARVFATNKAVENVEVGIEKEDGSLVWVSVSAVPVPFDDWKVLLATTEITARKQAEQSLDHRLSLETLMANISATLASVSADQSRFDEAIHHALAQLGEFLQVDRISLVRYCAEAKAMSTINQWCAAGVPSVLGDAQQVPVENLRWLETFLQSGQVVAVSKMSDLPPGEMKLAQFFDIESVALVPLLRQDQADGLISIELIQQERVWPETEFNILLAIGQMFAIAIQRHQTITALQESESRFRQIAENISDVFYLTDRVSGRILYISPAYEQVWGRSRELLYEDAGEFVEAIEPADRPLLYNALDQQLQGIATEIEYRVIRPDGSVRWVRDRAFPVRSESGRVKRVPGLVADISTTKALVINLERINRRLQGLRAIDRAILQANDLAEPPFVAALRHLHGLIPCQEAIIFTFDIKQNLAKIVAHLVEGRLQKLAPDDVSLLESLHHHRLSSGQPQLVELAENNLERPVDRQRFNRGLRAALLLPLISHGELLGKLTLLAKEPDFFTPDYLEVAGEVAGQVALALHQARLGAQVHQYTIELEQRVTERTAEISRVSQRLELAIQAGEIGIWEWNVKSNILVWDAQMRNLFGLSPNQPEQLELKDWEQMVYPEDLPRAMAELEGGMRGERSPDSEFRIVRPDGSRRYIKAYGRPVFNAAGEVERMIGVNIDITDRKEAEQKMRRSRDQLSAANAELARLARLKDEFLANMSHELRTPLNAILGLAEILLEGVYGALNENQVKSMRVLEESGRHLLTLINDILDVSKMEVGKLALEIALVNVEVLCQSSLRLVNETAQKKQLKINTRFDDAVTFISGDERRLKQLLVNLLSNAVKFTPAGGSIGLEVKGIPEQELVQIVVWDTGIGIAQADMERLFQPFIQIDSSLSRQHAGTGLGLVLVQRIAELHGGSVAMTSVVNQGSRLTVSLPWTGQIDRLAAADDYQEAAMLQLPQLKQAMLVEDHPLDARPVMKYLADWGITATLLSQGEGVVDRVAASLPDVILLDLQLPGLSGWTVLAQLKANPRTQHIPVIITSAVDETAQGLALGAAGYLVKPFTRQQLLDALNHGADQPARRAAVMVAAGQPDQPCLILLAEDNEQNIMTIRDFLEAQGFRLIVARNGLEAVDMAFEERPDLILMDIQMPEMNGLEAMRKIRADSEQANVPIIAVTALAMPGDRERCLAAGANDYLTKPVSLKRLREVVMSHLTSGLA